MYKLEKPFKVICIDVDRTFGLTRDKEYYIIGNDNDDPDPMAMCNYVENDYGEVLGYSCLRFKRADRK